jgi:acyl-CoA thioesterase FadM
MLRPQTLTSATGRSRSFNTAADARLGTSSIRTREEIATLHGELAARAESVMVARDESGRPRPLTDAERAALDGR